MAGLKPSVNLFACLDSSDPGDKRLADLDAANAKNKAASLTQEPSARDLVIRQNQLERKAKAKKRAAARANKSAAASSADSNNANGKIKADGAKRGGGGYSNGGPSWKQQSGASAGFNKSYGNNGASGRQQPSSKAENKVPGQGVQAPPPAAAVKAPPPPAAAAAAVKAPPPSPPSLCDIDEFPSLK